MSDVLVVPFGKHKGKSIERLLEDEQYVNWLKAQPWFPRFTTVYNVVMNVSPVMPVLKTGMKHTVAIDDADTPTPQHNRIQNLFLDHTFCETFVSHVDPLPLPTWKDTPFHKTTEDAGWKVYEVEALKEEAVRVTYSQVESRSFRWDSWVDYRLSNEEFDLLADEDTMHKQSCRLSSLDTSTFDYDKVMKLLPAEVTAQNKDALTSAIKQRIDDLRQMSPHPFSDYKDTWTISYKKGNKYDGFKVTLEREGVKVIFKNRPVLDCRVKFEHNGWDAVIKTVVSVGPLQQRYTVHRVEIKPTLGDDYPCVLRQMQRARKTDGSLYPNVNGDHTEPHDILLVGNFESAATTKGQLHQIFKASAITVVYLADLPCSKSDTEQGQVDARTAQESGVGSSTDIFCPTTRTLRCRGCSRTCVAPKDKFCCQCGLSTPQSSSSSLAWINEKPTVHTNAMPLSKRHRLDTDDDEQGTAPSQRLLNKQARFTLS